MKPSCSGTATSASTLFPVLCVVARGLLDAGNFGKLFLVFSDGLSLGIQISEARIQDGWNSDAISMRSESYNVVTFPMSARALKLKVAQPLPRA